MLNEHEVTYSREEIIGEFIHEFIYLRIKDNKISEHKIWIDSDSLPKALLDLNRLCYNWTHSGYKFYIKPFFGFY